MRILDWETVVDRRDSIPGPVALTIGVFDGVHRGHRSLIEMVRGFSELTTPAVLTFRANPARRLQPQTYQGDLQTLGQRLEKLESLGVGTVILAEFDDRFRRMRAEEFLDRLRGAVDLRYLAIGRNFRCGREMQMTARDVRRYLEPLGVRVDIATPVVDNEHKVPVSSTVIRRAVLDGELERVRHLLGSDFEVDVADAPLERDNTECRLRKHDCSQVLPRSGLFEVELCSNGSSARDRLTATESHIRWARNCNTTNRVRFLRQLRLQE